MNKLILVAIAWTLAVGGACGAPPAKQVAATEKAEQGKPVHTGSASTRSDVLAPAQAIAAASKTEEGAEGVFEFQIGSIGQNTRKGRPVFLNSETDYHSPKNLSVMIRPAAVKDIETAVGGSLDKALAHRRIKVTGVAKQAKVAVYDEDHKKTGESYMQTRIVVADARQIVFK